MIRKLFTAQLLALIVVSLAPRASAADGTQGDDGPALIDHTTGRVYNSQICSSTPTADNPLCLDGSGRIGDLQLPLDAITGGGNGGNLPIWWGGTKLQSSLISHVETDWGDSAFLYASPWQKKWNELFFRNTNYWDPTATVELWLQVGPAAGRLMKFSPNIVSYLPFYQNMQNALTLISSDYNDVIALAFDYSNLTIPWMCTRFGCATGNWRATHAIEVNNGASWIDGAGRAALSNKINVTGPFLTVSGTTSVASVTATATATRSTVSTTTDTSTSTTRATGTQTAVETSTQTATSGTATVTQTNTATITQTVATQTSTATVTVTTITTGSGTGSSVYALSTIDPTFVVATGTNSSTLARGDDGATAHKLIAGTGVTLAPSASATATATSVPLNLDPVVSGSAVTPAGIGAVAGSGLATNCLLKASGSTSAACSSSSDDGTKTAATKPIVVTDATRALSYPTPGKSVGNIHIVPSSSTNGNTQAITFGSNSGTIVDANAQAGLYAQTSGAYGSKLCLATSDNFSVGSKCRLNIDSSGAVTVSSTVGIPGASSGVVTLAAAAAAGTWTLTLPTTGGTNGYVLQTNGSGTTTWAAQSSYALPVATGSVLGGVKSSASVAVDGAGVMSVSTAYLASSTPYLAQPTSPPNYCGTNSALTSTSAGATSCVAIVPQTRTVCGHALNADVACTAGDVGAVPSAYEGLVVAVSGDTPDVLYNRVVAGTGMTINIVGSAPNRQVSAAPAFGRTSTTVMRGDAVRTYSAYTIGSDFAATDWSGAGAWTTVNSVTVSAGSAGAVMRISAHGSGIANGAGVCAIRAVDGSLAVFTSAVAMVTVPGTVWVNPSFNSSPIDLSAGSTAVYFQVGAFNTAGSSCSYQTNSTPSAHSLSMVIEVTDK